MTVVNQWIGGVTESSVRSRANIDGGSARFVVFDPESNTIRGSDDNLTPDADGIVSAEVTGLDPDTRYGWGYFVDGQFTGFSDQRFTTHPPIGQPASFQFAVVACAGGTTVPGGGDVLAGGRISNIGAFREVSEHDPLFVSHVGDMHYYDLGSGRHGIAGGASLDNYRRAYDDVLAQPNQQTLFRRVPLNYIWDDHDYGPNNSDGTHTGKGNAAQAYRDRIPHYDLAEATGPIYHAFQVGRVLHIVSDVRFDRSPNSDPDDASKTMLGQAQKDWMETLLATNADGAEALIWHMPDQWMGSTSDTWNDFRTEQTELTTMFGDLGWLRRMCIVAGDTHVLAIDDGGGNTLDSGPVPQFGMGGFPVYQFASMDSGPVQRTTYQYNRGGSRWGVWQYGTMHVRDRGFRIDIRGTGWFVGGSWRTYQFSVDTTTGLP